MLAFPIGMALSAARLVSMTISIQQSYVKDPRYFSLSFQKMFDEAWKYYDGGGVMHLSRDERIIEADKTVFRPVETCDAIVYAQKQDFFPSEGVNFEKEIYVQKNACLDSIPLLRAIACKGELILGPGTRVVRWADAEGVFTINDGCILGVSATSATRLVIGEDCYFKRLYAPEIRLGIKDVEQENDPRFIRINKAIVFPEIVRNIRYVDDQIVNHAMALRSSIITSYDLTVLGGFEVQGHIRSSREVKINDNATVHGNVFAEGNIHIGANARVYGVVFSQENIFVDSGVTIGLPGKTKSVVARGDISFGNECRVYGYIGAEGTGSICPSHTGRRFIDH